MAKQTENIRLYQGDCLDVMLDNPNNSVNLILCDLPYGTLRCGWDNIIPFEPLWAEYKRIIKPCGVICLFGAEPFSTKVRNSNFDWYKYDWYWIKNRSTLFHHAKNRPTRSVENICVFSPAKWGHKNQVKNRMTYNPVGANSCGNKIVGRGTINSKQYGERPKQVGKEYEAFTGFPNDILYFDCDNKPLHPTQKPVKLLEFLIKSYTNTGDLVLDNCMGSGSTGVACVNTGRRFIGIEKDRKYFNVSKERLCRAEDSQKCKLNFDNAKSLVQPNKNTQMSFDIKD